MLLFMAYQSEGPVTLKKRLIRSDNHNGMRHKVVDELDITRMFQVVRSLDILERPASFLRPSELLLNKARKSSVWPSLQSDAERERETGRKERKKGQSITHQTHMRNI